MNGSGYGAVSSCAENEVHEPMPRKIHPTNISSKYDDITIPQIPDATKLSPDALLDSFLSGDVCVQFYDDFTNSGSPDPTSYSLHPDPFNLAKDPREPPHHCDHPGCTMKFGRQSDLKKHQRVHISRNERQHPCPACEMKFIWPKDLKRHMRSRHSEGKDNNREYFCPEVDCDYNRRGFQRKDKMVRHWRRMHEAPPSQTSSEQSPSSNDYGKLLIGSSNDLLSFSPPCFDCDISSLVGVQDFGNQYLLLSDEPYLGGMANIHVESE